MQGKGRIGIDGIGQPRKKGRNPFLWLVSGAIANKAHREIGNGKVNQHNHVAHNQLETIYILDACG